MRCIVGYGHMECEEQGDDELEEMVEIGREDYTLRSFSGDQTYAAMSAKYNN